MNRIITLVALGKYDDIFQGFRENVEKYVDKNRVYKVFVQDGRLITNTEGWLVKYGPKKFSMAGNANLGWKAVDPTSDILYLGDDVRFKQEGTVEELCKLAYSDPAIGMLSPRICGGADNPLQTDPPTDKNIVYSDRYLALVCTYIKREVIEKVGYLDEETFKGYGSDDVDYSRRVMEAGYRLAVAPNVEVQHGINHRGTETFMRNVGGYYEDIQAEADANAKAYEEKWSKR